MGGSINSAGPLDIGQTDSTVPFASENPAFGALRSVEQGRKGVPHRNTAQLRPNRTTQKDKDNAANLQNSGFLLVLEELLKVCKEMRDQLGAALASRITVEQKEMKDAQPPAPPAAPSLCLPTRLPAALFLSTVD